MYKFYKFRFILTKISNSNYWQSCNRRVSKAIFNSIFSNFSFIISIYLRSPDNKSSDLYFHNYGGVVVAGKVGGNIKNKLSYKGKAIHIDETWKNLPSNAKNYSNIGDVIRVKKFKGRATIASDVYVVQNE